jgi:hypothetical protein
LTVVKIDETRLDEAVGHLSEGRPLKGREAIVAEFTPTFGTLVGMDHCLHELTSVNAVHLRDRYYVFVDSYVAGHARGRKDAESKVSNNEQRLPTTR